MRKSIKNNIITLVITPVVLLGAMVIILTLTLVRSALLAQVEQCLKGTAAATLASYDQNSGGYMRAANGDIWKGGFNITKSTSLVDSIKEQSGTDVAFYYENDMIITSIMNENGDRVLDSASGDAIVERVLSTGQPVFSTSVSVNGVMNYGYYLPIFAKATDETPVAMIFACTDKSQQNAQIYKIVACVVGIVLVMMVLCTAVSVAMSNSLIGSLNKSIGHLHIVSSGNLGVEIDSELLKRNDEVGELTKSLAALQSELRKIVSKLQNYVHEIRISSEDLSATSQETTAAMQEVSNSVTTMAESAQQQARQSGKASDTVADMGKKISRTTDEVKSLTENAAAMDASGKEVINTMKELIDINDEVKKSVDLVTEQTNLTNVSAQKIKKAADIIVGIAEETNLLALNASIEAARAGESGKGFAVVASQIQHLAEQSNYSSTEIIQIIEELLRESDKSVEAIRHVQATIDTQNKNMVLTGKVVGHVSDVINASMQSIGLIGDTTGKLAESRREIVDTVEALAKTANENAEITRKTNDAATDVNVSVEQVTKSAEKLQEIAEELSSSFEYFRL